MEIPVGNANKGASKNRGRKYRRCKFTKEDNYEASNELVIGGPGQSSTHVSSETSKLDIVNLPSNEFIPEGESSSRKRSLDENHSVNKEPFMAVESCTSQGSKELFDKSDFGDGNRRNDEVKTNGRNHLHKSKWTSRSQESDFYRGHRNLAETSYQEGYYCQSYPHGYKGLKMYEDSGAALNGICGLSNIPEDCRSVMQKEEVSQIDETMSRTADFNYESVAENVYYQNIDTNGLDPYSVMAYGDDGRGCRDCYGNCNQGACVNSVWPYNGACPGACPYSPVVPRPPNDQPCGFPLMCYFNPWNPRNPQSGAPVNPFQCLVCPMFLPMCNVNGPANPYSVANLMTERTNPTNPYPVDLPPYPPPYFSPQTVNFSHTKHNTSDNAASDRDGCSCINCSLSLGPCLVLQSTTKIGWEKIYCEIQNK